MKTFLNYLGYRLKSSLLQTAVFTLMSLLITALFIPEEGNESGLTVLPILLGILVTIIPILELTPLKNKRNLDTLYAFPLDRIKLAAAHYLSGIIQITCIYALMTCLAAVLLKDNIQLDIRWLFPLYIATLLAGIAIYSIIAFLFSAANTVIDGIITLGGWIALPGVLLILIQQFIVYFKSSYNIYYTIYDALYHFSLPFITQIENYKNSYYKHQITFAPIYQNLIGHILFVLVSVCAGVLFFAVLRKKPAHRIGSVSDALVCYPFLVPLYTLLALETMIKTDFNALTLGIILISAVIGLIVFRRGFRFKKQDLISLAAVLLVGLFIGSIGPLYRIESENSITTKIWHSGNYSYEQYQTGDISIDHPVFLDRLYVSDGAQMTSFQQLKYTDSDSNKTVFEAAHLAVNFSTEKQFESYLDDLKKNAAQHYEKDLDQVDDLFYTVEDEESSYTYLYLKDHTLEGQENVAGYQTTVRIGKDTTASCGYAVIAYSSQHFTVMQSYAKGTYIREKMELPAFMKDRSLNYTVTFE